jgi:hypothetical protein
MAGRSPSSLGALTPCHFVQACIECDHEPMLLKLPQVREDGWRIDRIESASQSVDLLCELVGGRFEPRTLRFLSRVKALTSYCFLSDDRLQSFCFEFE